MPHSRKILTKISEKSYQNSISEAQTYNEQELQKQRVNIVSSNAVGNAEDGDKEPYEEGTKTLGEAEWINMTTYPDDISIRDCGEPLRSQLIQLDFSPIDGQDDNECTIKQCVDFWKFINGRQELKTLKVKPEIYNEKMFTEISQSSSTSSSSSESSADNGPTPITVMAQCWLQQEELISSSLATKAAKPHKCEPIPKDYKEYIQKNENDMWPTGMKHKYQDSKTTTVPSKTSPVDDLVQMMAEMHKWDLEHPKCLEPPTTTKSWAIVKPDRKRSILPYIDKNDDKNCEKCLH